MSARIKASTSTKLQDEDEAVGIPADNEFPRAQSHSIRDTNEKEGQGCVWEMRNLRTTPRGELRTKCTAEETDASHSVVIRPRASNVRKWAGMKNETKLRKRNEADWDGGVNCKKSKEEVSDVRKRQAGKGEARVYGPELIIP
ncbi:hypothetical protein K438DRAFT_1789058 [Mycena galopus ATCC 62051]|nr:hypothetical protein K438DRAFT_1789058 [Mycena galopus ATCC 62051]